MDGEDPRLFPGADKSDTALLALRAAIETGANVNYEKHSDTPLTHAAYRKNPHALRILLEEGKADADRRDPEGFTPLEAAVLRGSLECIDVLVVVGHASINNNGFRRAFDLVLRRASVHRTTLVAALLLMHGALIDIPDPDNAFGDCVREARTLQRRAEQWLADREAVAQATLLPVLPQALGNLIGDLARPSKLEALMVVYHLWHFEYCKRSCKNE